MQVLSLIVPVFAVVIVGYFAVRLKIVPGSIAGPLTQFVYHICLPALMFHIIAQDPLHSLLNWKFWIAFGGGSLLLLALVTIIGRRWLGDGLGPRAIMAFTAVQTNAGFVALPVMHALFGAKGVPPAAIANVFIAAVSFPILATMLETARGTRESERKPALKLARDVFLSPMVWPAALGFVFAAFQIPVPKPVDDFLVILGAALTPCALFAIGASLDLGHVRHDAGRIAVLSTIKLIGLPALVLAIAVGLDMDSFFVVAAVICAAVPTAKNVYFLASEYGFAEKNASAMISATTVAAVVTITGWLVILAALYPSVFQGKI